MFPYFFNRCHLNLKGRLSIFLTSSYVCKCSYVIFVYVLMFLGSYALMFLHSFLNSYVLIYNDWTSWHSLEILV
jgi:hypothetical protein